MTFFARLIQETAEERQALYQVPQIIDGLCGNISRETYLSYLAEAYHHVKHTVPLMMSAGAKISGDKEWIRQALVEYIDEENGHEAWILEDIAHAGGDAQKVRDSQPSLETELMVSYAYDFINRINPIGFFGMVFVLEGTSTQLATHAAQAIMQQLHLTENSFHYLLSHGSIDVGHMKFFETLMNKIDDPGDQQDIIHMAKRMFILFANVFRAIPHTGDGR